MHLCGYMYVYTTSDVNPNTESVYTRYQRREIEGREVIEKSEEGKKKQS